MIFARDRDGVRVEAAPGRQGWCPGCGESLVARCGEFRTWHWAHSVDSECDPWWEPETHWHRAWKEICVPESVEVAYGEHRADILARDGAVIELQHSPIAAEEIGSREGFYGKMLWLLDGMPIRDYIRVELASGEPRFTWAYGRPTWFRAKMPVFIHGFSVGTWIKKPDPKTGRLLQFWNPISASNDILQIRSLKYRPTVHGVGRIITLDAFATRLLPLKQGVDLADCLAQAPFVVAR